MRCSGRMLAEKDSGRETSRWNGGGEEFRVRDIRMEWRRRRIPGVKHPDGMAVEKNSGCETFE